MLYIDMAGLRKTESKQDSSINTGAAVISRHAYAMVENPDAYAEGSEDQVPIFVLTHNAPQKRPRENGRLTFTFVEDGLESAIAQAKAAAGEKDVTVIGGAVIARQIIRAGLADELDIDIMPVLLGDGLRLFEDTGTEPVQLKRLKVMELPGGRTHLRFRIEN